LKVHKTTPGQPVSRLLLLAVFFFFGIFLGQVLAGRIPIATTDQLTRYLRDYATITEEQSVNVKTIGSALVLYLRYPLLAFFMGFTSVGIFALPLITVFFGLFLSFAVCCFVTVFGPEGVFLAVAVLGMRCMITLPCYFVLAVPSWGTAAVLASSSFGRGRRCAAVTYDRTWWIRLAGCGLVLLSGVCLDFIGSPWLLMWAMEHFVV